MPRSPWVADITPLKRQPGTQRPFTATLAPPAGVSLATAEIVADELVVDLQLEIAGDELIAQGSVSIAWHGPCRRCLDDQSATSVVDVREIFQTSPIEGETYLLDEDDVDLEPMIRETVLLNLPIAPLCDEACAGPDPDRFPTSVVADRPDEGDGDDEPPVDPRWSALSELTFDE